MKKQFIIISLFILFVSNNPFFASNGPAPVKKIFSVDEIKGLAEGYVNNNLGLKNPAIVDVDGDGNFDILIFNNGNVEYYRNTGTLEKPFFVSENMHYDKYSTAFFFEGNLPYTVIFPVKNRVTQPDLILVYDWI